MLKLFLISQDERDGWDVYYSAVVVAETEDEARLIHPSGRYNTFNRPGDWASSPDNVEVEYLGILSSQSDYPKGYVICSDFNAG